MRTSNLYFFTATILEWKHALNTHELKEIIVDSMRFLAANNRARIYAFIIMPNHIHIVWQINPKIKKGNFKRDFLKYTAQQIKFELQKSDPLFLEEFFVRSPDRMFQLWERNSLWFELIKDETIIQKINYIHNNPISKNWNLAENQQAYKWSSAKFYETEEDEFGFLHHIGTWKEQFTNESDLSYT